jgi:hypothetical protein
MGHDQHRGGAGAGRRVARAWRVLTPDRRLAAYASVGLFVTLFFPWYDDTIVAVGRTASASLTGWQAFSFVEAAVLLVAVAVLVLLFQRAEGHPFHVPGGDGGAITAAGLWTAALVVWRIFDKQSVSVHGPGTTVSGVHWGIFVALAAALLLLYAGNRIRAAHAPEPLLPGEGPTPPEPAVESRPLSPIPTPVTAAAPAAGPAGADRVGPAGADRVGPAAADWVGPAAADWVGPTAADRVQPAAADRVGPTAADRVEPAAADRVGPTAVPPPIPERRPEGWLTAPPRQQRKGGERPASRPADDRAGGAQPSAPDDAPARAQPTPQPARRPPRSPPDEQLTIPLEDRRGV